MQQLHNLIQYILNLMFCVWGELFSPRYCLSAVISACNSIISIGVTVRMSNNKHHCVCASLQDQVFYILWPVRCDRIWRAALHEGKAKTEPTSPAGVVVTQPGHFQVSDSQGRCSWDGWRDLNAQSSNHLESSVSEKSCLVFFLWRSFSFLGKQERELKEG